MRERATDGVARRDRSEASYNDPYQTGEANDLARALLAAGADPGIVNRYGLAPIHEASRVADVELLTLLLDAGADVNHALAEGETRTAAGCSAMPAC